jgi:putative transposase
VVVTKSIEILKDLAQQESFSIWAYCFMPDHVHLLIEGEKAEADMRRFTRLLKQKAGYWFKSIYHDKLWQPGYYERVLRDDEATLMVVRYILENPVRKGLVQHFTDYPYLGSLQLDDICHLANGPAR